MDQRASALFEDQPETRDQCHGSVLTWYGDYPIKPRGFVGPRQIIEDQTGYRELKAGSFRQCFSKVADNDVGNARRDRSRPVGVEAVEAFSRKCEDTGIDRGIIVSAKGFTKTAIRKVDFHSIGCLSLDQATGFDWCLAPGMEYKLRNITHTRLFVAFRDGTDLTQPPVLADGRPMKEDVNAWSRNLLTGNSDKFPFDVGEHVIKIRASNPPIFIGTGSDRIQAVHADFTITYTVKVDLALFKFRKYSNSSADAPITEAAIATFPIAQDRDADLVLSTGTDGITIHLVPHQKKADASTGAPSSQQRSRRPRLRDAASWFPSWTGFRAMWRSCRA